MRKCTSWPRSGERNWGITDYLCEVVVNPISTSMTRKYLFISDNLYDSPLQAWLLSKIWASFHVTNPSDTSVVGSWTFACEVSEISVRRLRISQVLLLQCLYWQLGLRIPVQLTLSVQLLEQSHKQLWGLSFPAVFSLFKVLESQRTQIKQFMHFGIEETALEKLSNCNWINANQGLRIARNKSGWGAEKPGRVSECKGGVAGEHYLI